MPRRTVLDLDAREVLFYAAVEAILASLTGVELSVPLVDPFVIATGRVDRTRSVEVVVALRTGEIGRGEAAALPPVTREDQSDVLRSVARAAAALEGRAVGDLAALGPMLDEIFGAAVVARAGVETAILDAVARRAKVPVRTLLGGELGAVTQTLTTDITIPILPPSRMVALAREWRGRGFTCFKVKVGKDVDADLCALEAIHLAVADATFRVDANAGFTAREAIYLAHELERLGLAVECFEQPCAPLDLDAMAEVAAALTTPVVADESVATAADLARLVARGAADGINLKLAKSGGPLAAFALGSAARAAGLTLMVGGMVETRLGMTAAAHVAAALGGVEYVDLDTAWLLAEDPFVGGYAADGPRYTLSGDGLGVSKS